MSSGVDYRFMIGVLVIESKACAEGGMPSPSSLTIEPFQSQFQEAGSFYSNLQLRRSRAGPNEGHWGALTNSAR